MLRKLTIVGVAIALSAVLLRGVLSSALVTRGDDVMFSGNAAGALEKYLLAHQVDAANSVAVDRYAFAAIRSHDTPLLEAAVRMIDATPGSEDTTLMLDRALCLHLLGRYEEASIGFERVARIKRDARAMLFAALEQKHVRHASKAKQLVALAVSFEPNFTPARDAFARSLRW